MYPMQQELFRIGKCCQQEAPNSQAPRSFFSLMSEKMRCKRCSLRETWERSQDSSLAWPSVCMLMFDSEALDARPGPACAWSAHVRARACVFMVGARPGQGLRVRGRCTAWLCVCVVSLWPGRGLRVPHWKDSAFIWVSSVLRYVSWNWQTRFCIKLYLCTQDLGPGGHGSFIVRQQVMVFVW